MVSNKSQNFLTLLRKGMKGLIKNVNSINPLFIDQFEPLILLTTQVENLNMVSHLKNERFSTLSYGQDFEKKNDEGISQKNNDGGCKVFHS